MMVARRHPRFNRRRAARRGFTLIEVLFTFMLLGIILPPAMRIVTMTRVASKLAQHRSEAAGLAESKLTELVSTFQTQAATGSSGNFADQGWPDYSYEADIGSWDGDQTGAVQELRVTVTWNDAERGVDSVIVSTLFYQSNAAAQSAAGGTTTP